jgi:Rer1 family
MRKILKTLKYFMHHYYLFVPVVKFISLFAISSQIYQSQLDSLTPHNRIRWGAAIFLLVLFLLRIFTKQGFYIITYALGIYHLNLFIAFLTPKMDPALDLDGK